ncbi:hypothetical protein ASE63_08160 [Bosea sp. Root381]|uniref:hypothetical protein n=1 Tax=Bosea sp. Root381 TaxID=1736524 RepID=UPI0006FB7FC0|nr:hypothetical protein [Bosea sp. Root381]KRE00066.1 hypothetical protein ASE63_08160 [Bosea sp. Root381]
MGEKTERAYCRTCEAPVLATKQKPAHVLHLLLTLVTLGVWLIVWIVLTLIASMKSYRCPTCGDRTVPYTRKLRKEFEARGRTREARF